ncbi:hypothetical protein HK414_23195 [Ramlibacter terrae]|uniref:Uncharacterized protein n=1 Tax=Ramlibacter terrae TaxID=2732511 RepID=A0ABX6P5B9_9BURK|nr:hypothetical protein HK414_23195 [Ramlibacter terrae]
MFEKTERIGQRRHETIRLVRDVLRAMFIQMFGDPEVNQHRFPMGLIRDMVASASYGTSEKASDELRQFPVLRMGNITYEGGWDLSNLKYVDLDPRSREKYLARAGDLIFNRTNSKELVGKTAVFDRADPMAIAGYLVRGSHE